MKNKYLVSLSRVSIVILFLVGVFICLWWYPFSISLGTVGLVSGESSSSIIYDKSQAVAFWAQLIFAWLTSIPCFYALILCFKSTIYAKRDEFFTKKNAIVFKKISVMMVTDSIVLVLGNILFMFLEWNPFALVYYVIGILGIIFALTSYFFYCYLEKATIIKEENDSIL